jgi:hypothetical protein
MAGTGGKSCAFRKGKEQKRHHRGNGGKSRKGRIKQIKIV